MADTKLREALEEAVAVNAAWCRMLARKDLCHLVEEEHIAQYAGFGKRWQAVLDGRFHTDRPEAET